QLARKTRIGRSMRRVPQGGFPSVLQASTYPVRDRAQYIWANLNRRLIVLRELVTKLECVAFAAAGVKKFDRMIVIDLFAEPVHVDFDCVGKRIKRIVPDMSGDLGARHELAGAPREVFE